MVKKPLFDETFKKAANVTVGEIIFAAMLIAEGLNNIAQALEDNLPDNDKVVSSLDSLAAEVSEVARSIGSHA